MGNTQLCVHWTYQTPLHNLHASQQTHIAGLYIHAICTAYIVLPDGGRMICVTEDVFSEFNM